MTIARPIASVRLPAPRVLWICCGVLAIAGLTTSAIAWGQSKAKERVQTQRLARIDGYAKAIRDAEGELPSWTRLPRNGAAFAQEVGATIASVGLPASALASLVAEPDASGAQSTQVRARHATVVLAGVTLPQVGEFLSRWRARQPAWTVAGIDLAPEPGAAAAKAQTGGDLPLHAVLSLETLTLERPGTTSPRPARTGGVR